MRIVLVAILMLVPALPALAEDAFARYVPAVSLTTLRAGERLTAIVPADGHLNYLPAVSSRDVISQKIAAAHITVGVEVFGHALRAGYEHPRRLAGLVQDIACREHAGGRVHRPGFCGLIHHGIQSVTLTGFPPRRQPQIPA